jgi:hypothetical protein
MAKKETTTKKIAPRKKAVKKEKPIISAPSKPEVKPTVEEFEESLEALEIMNGDPAVIVHVEDTDAPVEEAVKEEEPVKKEEAPQQPAQDENKPKKGIISRIFGYLWNGQEMDY